MSTRFWEDTWLGDTPLAHQYPSLYNIVQRKSVLVATVLSSVPLNIGFRRTLTGNKWTSWLHLVHRLIMVRFSADSDSFSWKLNSTGVFTVKSMYRELMDGHTVFPQNYLWKIKIPLKIKIFMWFLYRKVPLTKDNLTKRNWMCVNNVVFAD